MTDFFRSLLRCGKRLIEIPDQVVQVLKSDREPHHILGDACGGMILVAQLLVCGGGGMDDEALGIADIREVREDLQGVDELPASFQAALDAEREDRALTLRKVLLSQGIVGAGWQVGVLDPSHQIVSLEILGESDGVGAMLFHPEGERLQALEE